MPRPGMCTMYVAAVGEGLAPPGDYAQCPSLIVILSVSEGSFPEICTNKKILRLREAMTGRESGGTDCHSQCAHWLRNDVQELSMAKPTYFLQNQQFKHSTTRPLDIRKPPHVPTSLPLARHCEPSRRMVWQSVSPPGPVRFCTTPGRGKPRPYGITPNSQLLTPNHYPLTPNHYPLTTTH